MKRLICFTLCLFLIFAGCSSATPAAQWQRSTVSTDIEPYARRAVEITDAYLSFQLTSSEARDAITELYSRMDCFDIQYGDSNYSETDEMIARNISSLYFSAFRQNSDAQYRQLRDEIAFAIGEPVTGYIYEPERNIWDEEDPLAELIDIKLVPFNSGSASITDDVCDCALFFDEMNVPKIGDLQVYAEYVFNRMLAEGKNITSLSMFYHRFGQSVFVVSILEEAGMLTGSVSRMDEPYQKALDLFYDTYTFEECAAMEDYPVEFAILTPLYEFSSMDDLPRAIAIAANFTGVQNISSDLKRPNADTNQKAEEVENITRDYPDAIGSEEQKLLTPLLPDEIFKTTAEENGLDGTLYKVYGTVTDITADADGNLNIIHLHTLDGDVVISNLALSIAGDPSFNELGEIDWDKLSSMCPMPSVGEFCRIFAEYQGFSEKYNAPFFIYGGMDYMTSILLNSVQ